MLVKDLVDKVKRRWRGHDNGDGSSHTDGGRPGSSGSSEGSSGGGGGGYDDSRSLIGLSIEELLAEGGKLARLDPRRFQQLAEAHATLGRCEERSRHAEAEVLQTGPRADKVEGPSLCVNALRFVPWADCVPAPRREAREGPPRGVSA